MSPPCAKLRPCALENLGPEVRYDHEMATLTMFEMLSEVGVHLHLGCLVGEPTTVNGQITEVSCADRRGSFMIRPRMVIDCSGGGDPHFRTHAARGIAQGRLHPDLSRLYLMPGFHPIVCFSTR